MPRSGTSRVEAVKAVEAAYDLQSATSGWLRRLACVARRSLDQGLGTQAVLYSGTDNGFVASAQGLSGSPTGFEDYVASLAGSTPIHAQTYVANLPPGLYAYSRTEAGQKDPEIFYRDSGCGGPEGIKDWIAMIAPTHRHFVVLGGLTRECHVQLPRRTCALWGMVAAHVAAGLQLRAHLAEWGSLPVEAVLTSSGRVEHAEGVSRDSPGLRDELRQRVLNRDRARCSSSRLDPLEALTLWPDLVDGRLSLLDRFEADGRRFVIAVRNSPDWRDPRALSPRECEVVRLVREGLSNKEIAGELGSSTSAVGTQVSCALAKLGLRCRETLIADASDSMSYTQKICMGNAEAVVKTTRTRPYVINNLTSAENAVAHGVFRGLSDAEIAQERGASVRTVANQLRAIFRKLSIQSRSELVVLLIRHAEERDTGISFRPTRTGEDIPQSRVRT